MVTEIVFDKFTGKIKPIKCEMKDLNAVMDEISRQK